MQVTIASATALNANIAGHCDKGIDRPYVSATVNMTLHAVANPHGSRVNRGKFFRQLANNIRRQPANLRRPLYGNAVTQIGFEFRVTMGIVVDEILINQSFVHRVACHTQRQSAI